MRLQAVRDLAGTDRVGTNLLGMVRGAEKLGFSARAVKGGWDSLSEIPLPAVAHVKTPQGLGHFIVLHRVCNKSVIVADPARGVQKLSREAFTEQWTGYLSYWFRIKSDWRRSKGARPFIPGGVSGHFCSTISRCSSRPGFARSL
jgi:ABC-type bacteriocin/lantibiotic exporter with double-glycine peptidase domain